MSNQIGPHLIPAYISYDLWYSTFYSGTPLNDADDKVAVVMPAPKTGTLDKVWFRTGTVTTGDTIRVSFQDINASGYVDNGVDQYRLVTIASADDNTWFTTGSITSDGSDSGVKRSVTIGEKLAVVFDYATYTSGNLSVNIGRNTSTSGGFLSGATCHLYESSWAASTIGSTCIALQYTDGVVFIPGSMPAVASSTSAISSATTPDEYANVFSVPYPVKLWGAGCMVSSAVTRPFDIVLYSADGSTILSSGSFGSIYDSSINVTKTLPFTTPYTINAGSNYYLSIKPTSTAGFNLNQNTFPSVDVMSATPWGSACYGATRTDAGAWTTNSLVQYSIFPIFYGFEDTAVGATTAYPVNISQTFIMPPYHPVGY